MEPHAAKPSVTSYLETLILRNGGKMPKKGG
jgi:hypothetical protein